MHHRRRCLSPSAYLGFLVSVLTGFTSGKRFGGAKRTAERAGGVGAGETGGDSKRRRQKAVVDRGGDKHRDAVAAEEAPPLAPLSLWETVFGRDDVTGAVCNSLAMIGTRGGALLDALQPTLLQLLRHGSGQEGGGRERARKDVTPAPGAALVRSPDEDSLAVALQGQRAAMACVLCCLEGLDMECSTTPAATANAANTSTATATTKPESPLSALERPVAAACVRAMKTAGTAEAVEQARGARLLRPVLLLVKRWSALLPQILALIVNVASDVTAAVAGGEDVVARGEGLGVTGVRSLEPLLRCLQAVVRDPGLQGPLRRRHLCDLRVAVKTLCGALDASSLKCIVVQLRADVELLGGGRTED